MHIYSHVRYYLCEAQRAKPLNTGELIEGPISIYIFVYPYIYIHDDTCIYVYICVYSYIHTYTRAHASIYKCIYPRTFAQRAETLDSGELAEFAYLSISRCIHIYTYIHILTHAYILYSDFYIYY